MKLLVGLGNPGAKYAHHRHNVGFMAVDAIHDRHGFGPWRAKFQAEIAEGRLGGERVTLLKPMTYMNESGQAVGQAARFFKIAPDEMLIAHDEIDLPPGKIRLKKGGGHGGHNGLRSLHAHLGDDYHRLRIGVGHPGRKEAVPGYVLRDFPKADADWLVPLLAAIADNAPLLAEGKASTFANKVHLAVQPADEPDAVAKSRPKKKRPAGEAKAQTPPPASPAQAPSTQAARPASPAEPEQRGPFAMLSALLRRR